jgi:SAM-dependent methyltransferase
MELAYGYMASRVVFAFTQLRIPEILAKGPRTAEAIAKRCQADPGAIRRLLRALVSVGVVSESSTGHFRSTPRSDCLRPGVAGSLYDCVLYLSGNMQWQAWGELLYSVRTGKTSIERVLGAPLFEYLRKDRATAAAFNGTMSTFSAMGAGALQMLCDFSTVTSVLDVAGGTGGLLLPILEANPRLKGAILDLPSVVTAARRGLSASGARGRCKLIQGDFFRSIPSGYDVYIVRNILHDWDDRRAIKILRNCRLAMPPHAVLLLMEGVVPDLGGWDGWRTDLQMLLLTGGLERTATEYAALCERARLRVREVHDLGATMSVLEITHAAR